MKRAHKICGMTVAMVTGVLIGAWCLWKPEPPSKWWSVKEGMPRDEVFKVLKWPIEGEPREGNITEYLGASPLLSLNDAVMEISFKQDGDVIYVSDVAIYHTTSTWFERVSGRYDIDGLRLWKW